MGLLVGAPVVLVGASDLETSSISCKNTDILKKD